MVGFHLTDDRRTGRRSAAGPGQARTRSEESRWCARLGRGPGEQGLGRPRQRGQALAQARGGRRGGIGGSTGLAPRPHRGQCWKWSHARQTGPRGLAPGASAWAEQMSVQAPPVVARATACEIVGANTSPKIARKATQDRRRQR
jgi:hypothetical protein